MPCWNPSGGVFSSGISMLSPSTGEKKHWRSPATHPLDVAILDLKMPGMSGKDVLIALKRDYPWLEVIILTGHGSFDPENEKEFGKAYSYLSKPCDLDTLLKTLVEAYKKTVMNRQKMTVEEMASRLQGIDAASPREILKKLKELDGNGQQIKT